MAPNCVAYIKLVFHDAQKNAAIPIAGAGFIAQDKADAAWANIREFDGKSCFVADRVDAMGDIVDDKVISAETCEKLTGKSIAILLTEARAALLAADQITYQ